MDRTRRAERSLIAQWLIPAILALRRLKAGGLPGMGGYLGLHVSYRLGLAMWKDLISKTD